MYTKAPVNYERIVYKTASGEHEFYVERQPSHEIPESGIESVRVGKTKKFGNSLEEQKELERIIREIETKGTVTKNAQETYPTGFYYSLTFKLTPPEWERYVAFSNKNLNGSFQMRLGKHNQGVLPFLVDESSATGREFTINTQEDNSTRIKERLSPLKNRVFWEYLNATRSCIFAMT